MIEIRIARGAADLLAAQPVVRELRPDVPEGSAFVERVRLQAEQGYLLAVLEADGRVEAVAGFRLLENLFSGRVLYVDDLVTAARARSRGHGAALLAWLAARARAEGCAALELDSGVQRAEAHRFYSREGLHAAAFHFRRAL